ncbi:hypothetical protein ACEPAF_5701 [Sanghuangporus sanghuang]
MFSELILLTALCTARFTAAGLTRYGSSGCRAEVYSSCTVPNTVAITFHDGPYIFSKDLVDIFNERDAKATFFVNGANWKCIYDDDMVDTIRYAHDAGHLIGSHGWNHFNLSEQSAETINEQMEKLEVALERIIGVTPAWMRPPNGSYNDVVREVSTRRGQSIILWDFNANDAYGATPEEIKDAYHELAEQHPSTALTINLEVKESTVYDVIPYAIDQFKSKGYELVTVSECLGGFPDYQRVTTRSEKDDSWAC